MSKSAKLIIGCSFLVFGAAFLFLAIKDQLQGAIVVGVGLVATGIGVLSWTFARWRTLRPTPKTPTRAKKAGLGTWSLVLAIGNICVVGAEYPLMLLAIPISILAVMLGIAALSQIRRSQGAVTGKPRAIVGIILGVWVGITPILLPLVNMSRQAARQIAAKSLVGRAVPSFDLERTDGGSVSSTSLSGSIYLLDFWPGPDSLRKLDAFAKNHKTDGLTVFAIVPEYAALGVSAFARENELDIPILLASETGETAKVFYAVYNRHTILVGRDGRVAGVFFGASYTGEIEEAVKSAMITK